MATIPIGVVWTQAASGLGDMQSMAYDPVLDLFCIAGGTSTPLLRTASGAAVAGGSPTFVQQSMPGSNQIRAVASDENTSSPTGEFVTGGSAGETHNSTNGTSWSLGTPVSGNPILTAVNFGGTTVGDLALAVGVSEIARQNSAGSPSFTSLVNPSETLRAVVAKAGTSIWVLVGNLASNGRIITSSDGNVFAAAYTDWATGRQINSVDHGGGAVFIACTIALGSSPFTPMIASSATGFSGSWTTQEGVPNDNLQTIRYLTGNNWVIGGTTGQIYHSSDNGTIWNQPISPISNSIVGFAYSAVHAVAALVTTNGEVWISKEITQSDPPTPVTPPAVTEPITSNPDISGTTIGRLISQFRG